jgi:hypothetical protein
MGIWTVPVQPIGVVLRGVREWPEASIQRSRRNAMVAATHLAQRRAERLEVEDYLGRRTSPDAHKVTGPAQLPHAR